MDCEHIFNAARDGKIGELTDILKHKPEDETRALVSALTNGATPLVVACKNGHLDVVTYLLEKCHADVEQAVLLENRQYAKGKPLYYAVASGDLNIVMALIKHKAAADDTNPLSNPIVQTCRKGIFKYTIEPGAADIYLKDVEIGDSSCLLVSCYRGHYEITKYLLECGSNVNYQNKYGDTALHASVRSGSLEIFKMLLQHGSRMCINQFGLTPSLTASCYCHASIVEYFTEECNGTKQEKVDALELLGATLMYEFQDMVAARNYWRQAMHLRLEDDAYILEKPIDKSLVSYYYATTEVCTSDQLNHLTDEEMEIQAVLIKQRILGPGLLESNIYLNFKGMTLAENGDFKRCIQLCISMLDDATDRQMDGVLDHSDIAIIIYFSIVPLTKLFYKMMPVAGNVDKAAPAISFWDILHVFDITTGPIKKALIQSQERVGLQSRELRDLIIIAMHLLNLMSRLQPYLKSNEEKSMKQAAYKLVHMNPKGTKGFPLVHIASSKCSSTFAGRSDSTYDEWNEQNGVFHGFSLPKSPFPSAQVVNLLLEVGACPNARDSGGNTPLHVAAMNRPCAADVFDTLLKQGAHIDLYNNEHKTPLQLVDDASLLDIYPLQNLNLQCLCAQAIDKHKLSYKGVMPKKLCEFIDLHGSH